jgi:hypothetical protein
MTSRGVEHLTKLKDLRVFNFRTANDDIVDVDTKIYKCILTRLPWLQVVGVQHHNFLKSPEELLYDNPPKNVKVSGTFMMQELLAANTLPLTANFPDLRTLYFWGPLKTRRSIDWLAKCTTLETLAITKTPQAQIVEILKKVGTNLTCLFLIENVERMDLSEIFNYCPNLVQFEMQENSGAHAFRSDFWTKLSSRNFSSLQTFKVCLDGKAPEGFIRRVLESPSISKVLLERIELTVEDCRDIKELGVRVKSFKILRLLNDDPAILDDFSEMIKSLLCHVGKFRLKFVSDHLHSLYDSRKDVSFFHGLHYHMYLC